ncbi:MAG: hypothetical protein AAGH64_05295 [Planctomycetota bacterium]
MTARRAFTVIETLVAIGLLLMLSAALSAFLFDVQSTRERLSNMGDDRLAGTLIIDAIEEAARFAVVASGGRSGLTGDRSSLVIVSELVALDTATPDAAAIASPVTRSLEWDERTGVLTLDDEPLSASVARLVMRYHDDDAWRDSYDAMEEGRLPAAIDVAMWFGEPEQDATDAPSLESVDLGEGFGLPTPREIAAFASDRAWGEPDRRRVVALPRLRPEDAR